MQNWGNFRIGNGFDVHAFSSERKLILGNIEISTEFGLMGHSDADVLLHAIIDALLGACGLPDIGCLFPNTDPSLSGVDSGLLLKKVWAEIEQQGWQLVNIDTVIMAQKPMLQPYMPAIREKIAGLLAVSHDRIGVKATTTERLGFVGREEGMAASAVCLLYKNETR